MQANVRLPPPIGLGTFKSKGSVVQEAVRCALQHGIRHIDTASVYKNEEDIGIAIKEAISSGICQREDLYITSKLSPSEQGTQAATAACEAILHRLGVEYIDLLLIHWPGVAKTDLSSPENAVKRLETWRVLEDFYSRGLVKAIGVSNYEQRHLEDLLKEAQVLPAVNQIECHPLWPQEGLRAYCAANGVGVVAYSSFACGAFFEQGSEIAAVVADTAKACGKTPSQVLLCWGLQKGCVAVLPKSVHSERIAEFSPNAPGMQKLKDGEQEGRWLPKEAQAALDALGATADKQKKFCWDPSRIY